MSWEHDDAIRNMLRRVRLVEVDDSGPQQKMRLRGLAGEEIRDVVRIQPYGFTSNPPVGSEGLLLSLGGRSDRGMVFGLEHPDHRPKGAVGGAQAIYDQHGNIASLVQSGYRVVHTSKITLSVGACEIEITPSEIVLTGPLVRHNARNIGDTHTHGGIVPGPSNTDIPNI